MAHSRDNPWPELFAAIGILETIEIAAGRLKLGLTQVYGRGYAPRKSEIEARFEQYLNPKKVVDAFLADIARALSVRTEIVPETMELTGASSFLTDIHRTANDAVLRDDFATDRDRFLALKDADPKSAFVFETLGENYVSFHSLVSMIAYPSIQFDLALIEARKRAAPSEDQFVAYEFGPNMLEAIRETNALTAGFIHGGLKDRTERDLLLFATFLASDDGRRMLYRMSQSLETALTEPLIEMLVPYADKQ